MCLCVKVSVSSRGERGTRRKGGVSSRAKRQTPLVKWAGLTTYPKVSSGLSFFSDFFVLWYHEAFFKGELVT